MWAWCLVLQVCALSTIRLEIGSRGEPEAFTQDKLDKVHAALIRNQAEKDALVRDHAELVAAQAQELTDAHKAAAKDSAVDGWHAVTDGVVGREVPARPSATLQGAAPPPGHRDQLAALLPPYNSDRLLRQLTICSCAECRKPQLTSSLPVECPPGCDAPAGPWGDLGNVPVPINVGGTIVTCAPFSDVSTGAGLVMEAFSHDFQVSLGEQRQAVHGPQVAALRQHGARLALARNGTDTLPPAGLAPFGPLLVLETEAQRLEHEEWLAFEESMLVLQEYQGRAEAQYATVLAAAANVPDPGLALPQLPSVARTEAALSYLATLKPSFAAEDQRRSKLSDFIFSSMVAFTQAGVLARVHADGGAAVSVDKIARMYCETHPSGLYSELLGRQALVTVELVKDPNDGFGIGLELKAKPYKNWAQQQEFGIEVSEKTRGGLGLHPGDRIKSYKTVGGSDLTKFEAGSSLQGVMTHCNQRSDREDNDSPCSDFSPTDKRCTGRCSSDPNLIETIREFDVFLAFAGSKKPNEKIELQVLPARGECVHETVAVWTFISFIHMQEKVGLRNPPAGPPAACPATDDLDLCAGVAARCCLAGEEHAAQSCLEGVAPAGQCLARRLEEWAARTLEQDDSL